MRTITIILHVALVSFLLMFVSEAVAAGELSTPPNIDDAMEFFVSALMDPKITIALCQGAGYPSQDEDFVLRSGEDLRLSTFCKYDQTQHTLRVLDAVKGKFDRLVVYPQTIGRGRIWPAFQSTGFIPPPDTQWIVFFREDPEGPFIEFYDYRTEPDGSIVKSIKPNVRMPVLKLASKDYGIIRYDAPNHLGIDAKEFLKDLKKLVRHVEEGQLLRPEELSTDIGKQILIKYADQRGGNRAD